MANRRKSRVIVSMLAVILCATIILGGTFAWQSISQTALNEVSAVANPGGRLHDDFVDITDQGNYETMTYNKDVYVENFTSRADNGVQVFARVRLDEYMELGAGAGTDSDDKEAKSLMPGANYENKNTWTTYQYGDTSSPFREYWTWSNEGGSTVYMPTFNKNKDSLQADVNGTFDQGFADHIEYSANESVEGIAIYDKDDNIDDEVGPITYGMDLDRYIADQNIYVESETHTAVETLGAVVMSMEEWKNDYNSEPGNYWVFDTDGWAYWANPIDPDSATGLLLDGIQRTDVIINEDWYYGINVVAQFITADDIGYEDNSGFYADGETVSDDAKVLLNKIGVKVTFEANDAESLKAALEHGGTIKLTDNVTIAEELTVTEDTVLDLGTYTISNSESIWGNGQTSMISVSGADTVLTINSGNFKPLQDDCYIIEVRDGAKVVINGGTFNGNLHDVFVVDGSAVITGGEFKLQQTLDTNVYTWAEYGEECMINAEDTAFADGTASITITGGTFYGFNPADCNDGNLVPNGYSVNENDTVYTVTINKTV